MTDHSLRTYPLEMPAPGRFYRRTAERLGWHPAAAALVTLGWLAAPQVTVRETSAGEAPRVSFFIGPLPRGGKEYAIKAAEKLVARAIPHGKTNLAKTEPGHPFLAALAAIDNLATLLEWHRRGGPIPQAYQLSHPEAAQPSPWLTLFLHGEKILYPRAELRPWPFPGTPPAAGIFDAAAAAAMIACGFIPFPELDLSQGKPALAFAAQSTTLPDFTAAAACEAVRHIKAQDARPHAVYPALTLPGYAPDEHPFLYAFRAACNVAHLHKMAARASRDPVRQFTNRFNSRRTALITDHLLHPGQNDLARRELDRHLNRRG